MTSETAQTRLLARTFFARLFESELIPPGIGHVRVVTSIIAFFAAPSLVLPLLLMKKYVWLWTPDLVRSAMAQDRTMAILLSMTATAFISLVIWENIFPDRRDSRILGVLPLRVRSFVIARLMAILALFALVFLLPTAIGSLGFGILGAMTKLPEGFSGVAFAHFISVAAAEGLVFFGIVAMQCALMSVAGPAAAHRLAVVLQMAIIITVLQMPMVLPAGTSFALDASGSPLWASTSSAQLLPPLWFLSLHESIARAGYPAAEQLARAAGLLGIGTPLLALGFYAASYRRLTRLAIEGRPVPPRRRVLWMERAYGSLAAFLTAAAQGAAVCAFTLRTLARSRQHRMLLAVWVGVAIALTISAALPSLVRVGWSALDRPREALLVGPFILAALVQTGMRSLFAIPVEIRANWAVRMAETPRLAATLDGASAALIICGVLPAAALALVSGTWLWGAKVGLLHAVFSGMVAVMFSQVLMFGVDRIPFTCTYIPGGAKISKLWPLYLTIFATVTYGMAAAESEMLRNQGRGLTTAILVLVVVSAASRWFRVRRARELPGLCFEAQPADTMTEVTLRAL
ncbi:MAG: hypothetical protein M3468_15310 [Acidobacteriota bacterium]|nr:hypothetical protein [Acidobacteriota bacterium]